MELHDTNANAYPPAGLPPEPGDDLPAANRALMAFAAWLVYETSCLNDALPVPIPDDLDDAARLRQEEADARLIVLIAAARARLRVIGSRYVQAYQSREEGAG